MHAPELLLYNGAITTLDPAHPQVSAVAIAGGQIAATGGEELLATADEKTTRIDLRGRRVIPGLNDSHIHVIRGGLNFNMELRWDGIPSLSLALAMLREQAARTPPPQWVRVVGGWSEFQFKERRMPTLEEINAAAPDTPVFILHLYDRALLNAAALRAVGYTKETPEPLGGRIQRDSKGNPSGILIAEPNAMILYATLAKGPKLPLQDQINSTRHFMRELNRLGVTSGIDAGGGFQNYPEDYQVIQTLHDNNQMTMRIAYNLFTQKPGGELADFQRWSSMVTPYSGDGYLRQNGAGEMLVFSAADFEDFLQPRPDMPDKMQGDLKQVVRHLAANRWPFRLHATYDQTISRALDVFEEVNREIPFNGLRWFFDHAETVSEKSLERIKKLDGSIAIQHRMAYQGEYFIDRYGKKAAEQSPPIRKMLDMGIRVGAGTDATRVASYNPWMSLYWLVSGKTIGGTPMYADVNRMEREEALRLYTEGSATLSREEDVKGRLSPGMYADLSVISQDFFRVAEEEIKNITSVLTVVGGQIVYAAEEFKIYDAPLPLVSPDWSPVSLYGGYYQEALHNHTAAACAACGHDAHGHGRGAHANLWHWLNVDREALKLPSFRNPWTLGCGCFAY